MPAATAAQDLVQRLGLRPHPEGGWFRELHRSALTVAPTDSRGPRSALTVIHYLLERGQLSRWHRVISDEQWTWLEGASMSLYIYPAGGPLREVILETGVTAIVPAGALQAARPAGDYTLVSCTVGPGFDFADWSLTSGDAEAAATVRTAIPQHVDLL